MVRREIVLCLGSSCFSRGNKNSVAEIKKFLSDHKLEDKVLLKGSHCFGKCDKGPVIHIDEKEYFINSNNTLIDILTKELL